MEPSGLVSVKTWLTHPSRLRAYSEFSLGRLLGDSPPEAGSQTEFTMDTTERLCHCNLRKPTISIWDTTKRGNRIIANPSPRIRLHMERQDSCADLFTRAGLWGSTLCTAPVGKWQEFTYVILCKSLEQSSREVKHRWFKMLFQTAFPRTCIFEVLLPEALFLFSSRKLLVFLRTHRVFPMTTGPGDTWLWLLEVPSRVTGEIPRHSITTKNSGLLCFSQPLSIEKQ